MTGSAEEVPKRSGNPFVGPRPLEAGERLWGRDQEIRELDNLLSAERVVLLHSPSGAGKSSLIQAGLVPRLRSTFDIWGPTRFSQEIPAAKEIGGLPVNRYVLSAVRGLEEGVPPRLRRSTEVLASQTLRQYVDSRPHRRSAPKSILLIFDQFEEVLTVDPLAVEAKRQLFDQLGDLLHDPRIWALFALREDYLAPLDPYAQQVPTHLKVRFRIDLLGLAGATQAMIQPAQDGGREFLAAEQLVHDLARVKVQQPDGSFLEKIGHHVEPVQLQVVCRRLWQAMPESSRSIKSDDLEHFGDVNQALAGYFADSVQRIAGGDLRREQAIRQWFDDHLITGGDIRGQVIRGAENSGGLANSLIEELLDTHLVRSEQRAGAIWYELAHDRLIEPVQDDNRSWRAQHLSAVQQRASLWEQQGRPAGLLVGGEELVAAERWADDEPTALPEVERRFLDASRRAQIVVDRDRRQARRIQRLAVIATLVGILAVFAGLVASFKWRESEEQTQKARNLAKAAIADNLLGEGRTLEGNLVALEVDDPALIPTAVRMLHKVLADPVESAIFEQHTGGVKDAAWSPDGRRVITSSDDMTARVWWADTGAAITVLEGHLGPVESVVWNPDGSRIATASADHTARIWEAESGQTVSILEGHSKSVRQVAWSPDGARIATASEDGSARLWDANSGQLELELEGHGDWVYSATWHPDGSRIVTASRDRSARLWDAISGEQIALLEGHRDRVNLALWSPDGSRVATISHDATARIWDSTTGRLVWELRGHRAPLSNAAWNPDGRRLATTSADHTARLWDTSTGVSITTLEGHSDWLQGAAWNADGSRLVTYAFDSTARLWHATAGETLAILEGHDDALTIAAWSPDRPHLVTASMDHGARVWNMATGEAIASFEGHELEVVTASFSPDDSKLLTASRDSTARIWDPKGQNAPMHLEGHTAALTDAAWSPDGSLVVTASADHTARLWDGAGNAVRVFEGHRAGIDAAAFSADGSLLATASKDHSARLWDVASGALLHTLQGHENGVLDVAWSADATLVLSASSDTSARLWDVASGELVTALYGHQDTILAAVWSPLQHQVATASKDATVRLWDVRSGEVVNTLEGHENTVTSVAFSPHGHRLVTGSLDQTARVWDASTGALVFELIGHSDALLDTSWSSDGRRIVTTSLDRTARLWDAESGEMLAVFEGHQDSLRTAAWNLDGSLIVTASRDNTARIWANVEDYPEFLQARARARTRLCVDAEFRHRELGEAKSEARRGSEICSACVPSFFNRKERTTQAAQWRDDVEAWQAYRQCVADRSGR